MTWELHSDQSLPILIIAYATHTQLEKSSITYVFIKNCPFWDNFLFVLGNDGIEPKLFKITIFFFYPIFCDIICISARVLLMGLENPNQTVSKKDIKFLQLVVGGS